MVITIKTIETEKSIYKMIILQTKITIIIKSMKLNATKQTTTNMKEAKIR